MNVAFFLIPKSQVVWLPMHATLGQAIAQLEQSGCTALPLLDDDERYAGTVTEGDILRELMRASEPNQLNSSATEQVLLRQVQLRTNVRPVGIDAHMEELFGRAIEQNFVPVADSRGVFVGIVRRREILEFCARVFAPRVLTESVITKS